MGIQSNINQALTLGSAGAYGIEHLKNNTKVLSSYHNQ